MRIMDFIAIVLRLLLVCMLFLRCKLILVVLYEFVGLSGLRLIMYAASPQYKRLWFVSSRSQGNRGNVWVGREIKWIWRHLEIQLLSKLFLEGYVLRLRLVKPAFKSLLALNLPCSLDTFGVVINKMTAVLLSWSFKFRSYSFSNLMIFDKWFILD